MKKSNLIGPDGNFCLTADSLNKQYSNWFKQYYLEKS